MQKSSLPEGIRTLQKWYATNSVASKDTCVCHVPAVSEVKLWLMSLKVFEYIFGDSKDEILYD